MTAPLEALKRAVHARLVGDAALVTLLGGAKIHDHPPPGLRFPYVTFGNATVDDWSAAEEEGFEILLTMHGWSRETGARQVLAIADRLRQLLHRAPPAADGFRLVDLLLVRCETGYEADAAVHHAALDFRALMEPVA